jgi:hypothetical protein
MILQLLSISWAAWLGFFSLKRLGLSQRPAILGALAFAILPCRIYPGSGRTSEILLCWAGPVAVFLLVHWTQSLGIQSLGLQSLGVQNLLSPEQPNLRPTSSSMTLTRNPQLGHLVDSGFKIFLLLLFILIPSFANSLLLISAPLLLYSFAKHLTERRVPPLRKSDALILCFAFCRGFLFDQTLFSKARNLQGSLLKFTHLLLPSPHNPIPPIQEWRSRNFGTHEPFAFESEVSRASSLGIFLSIGLALALINLLRPSWKRTEAQHSLLLLQLTLIPLLIFGGLGGISTWVVASASWIHFVAATTLTLEWKNWFLARSQANSTAPKHPRSSLQSAES